MTGAPFVHFNAICTTLMSESSKIKSTHFVDTVFMNILYMCESEFKDESWMMDMTISSKVRPHFRSFISNSWFETGSLDSNKKRNSSDSTKTESDEAASISRNPTANPPTEYTELRIKFGFHKMIPSSSSEEFALRSTTMAF
ncbi:hypothetical protein OGAPHI_004794 [Ogataea philodendri]|uniref:Uncharacterized protein n=1 Tax=Ogataea philodendri TaxID=1378263 RepID=A0A9P8P2I0_9ASCO|nr:uncharacterized protein OGAPHI_004794 [Ogataea philodendri]KAH3664080.1 hypothetical protein OGAPHI_004794 [Ogataea philodendri]